MPNPVLLNRTSPSLVSLITGSVVIPAEIPISNFALLECKNVVSATVLSRVVSALSIVSKDAVISNSSDVTDLIVSTV